MIRSFAILKRKPGLTREEYIHHWKEIHAPIAAKVIPGLKKYIQHHPLNMPGIEFDIDGIAEIWWEDAASLKSYLSWRETDQARVLIEDEQKFIDMQRTIRLFAEQVVIVA